MSARLGHLAARRTALCERSAELRGELKGDVRGLGARFGTADRLVAAARSSQARAVLLGAAALVVVGRPRKVLKLALRGITLWPLISMVLPQLKRLFQSDEDPKASR